MLSATLRTQIVRTAGTEPRKVGVKVGDWAEYEIAYNYTSNDPNPPQYPGKLATEMVSTKVTVLEVNGTKIKFEEIYRFKNGTELYETKSTDLSECYQLGVWFILPNLDPGDTVIQCPTSPVINATLTQEHCGVVREVNYVYQHLRYWSAPNYEADSITHMYWDKNTGFQVEANGNIYITELTEGYITDVFVHLLINETNIWKPDIIVPDDYPSIQQAINAANENDTIFVKNGTYYENVVIDKPVLLVGEGSQTTVVDAQGGKAVFHVKASNVTITDFTIRGADAGVFLDHDHYCNISKNIITNNGEGVRCEGSSNNSFCGNNITSNNLRGIVLCWSPNNFFRNNSLDHNKYNFGVYGSTLSASIQHIDSSNVIGGKPIFYIVNQNNLTINPSAYPDIGYLALVNSTNIIVEELEMANNDQGIYVAYTTNSQIRNNEVANNDDGICLVMSSNNSISTNTIKKNSYCGIRLWYGSNNSISNNELTNGLYGAVIFSSHNRLHHNNFIHNTQQVYIYQPDCHNFWDDGYPSGGNYWSDYDGVDTDPDGIGDSWYEIDENNIDHYPLMGLFSDFNATPKYDVQTVCNSTISNFQFNDTAVSFNVTGNEDTAGFCRICIPNALMSDSFRVFVNGTEILPSPEPLPCSNTTHNYLYFTYSHSTQGVIVIPEFPSFLIPPLFMIITLLAVIVYRRKHSIASKYEELIRISRKA